MNNKKIIIFDMDGTLTESKQSLDIEMATLLSMLIKSGRIVAVMSGGALTQYKTQFLPHLSLSDDEYQKLFLLPTSGASMYQFKNGNWHEVYKHTISPKNRKEIIKILQKAIVATGNTVEQPFGEIIEDRGSQITYSGLGQDAPLEIKNLWDPNQTKRHEIILYFSKYLPQFIAGTGGTTSIDITEKDIDKSYGIKQLSEILSIPISEMVFVGDALYPGGNDEPVKKSGIDCISVSSTTDTKKFIESLM